jgi:hypothetical protein
MKEIIKTEEKSGVLKWGLRVESCGRAVEGTKGWKRDPGAKIFGEMVIGVELDMKV